MCSLSALCVHMILCVRVCVRAHAHTILCVCFAMLCMKMFANLYVSCLLVYIPLVCIIMGVCTLYIYFFKVLKCFESPKSIL